MTKCPYCGKDHPWMTCPRVSSIRFRSDGSVKSVKLHAPDPSPKPAVPAPSPNEKPESNNGNGENGKGRFSATEAKLLEFLALGDSNKIIARKMGNREATVKVHVKSIFRKLGVNNRTQVAAWFCGQPSQRTNDGPVTEAHAFPG